MLDQAFVQLCMRITSHACSSARHGSMQQKSNSRGPQDQVAPPVDHHALARPVEAPLR